MITGTADSVEVGWDEDGFALTVETMTGERFRFLLPEPDKFYKNVRWVIEPWLRERKEARREVEERVVAMREDGSFRVEQDEDAYDLHDPKGPRFHSTHADIWDARAGK